MSILSNLRGRPKPNAKIPKCCDPYTALTLARWECYKVSQRLPFTLRLQPAGNADACWIDWLLNLTQRPIARCRIGAALCLAVALGGNPGWAQQGDALERSLAAQAQSDAAAAASQARIDTLAEAAAQDRQRWRIASQRRESLTIYNGQLERLIASQEAEMSSLTRQTDAIETIETGSLPLMIEKIDTLAALVAADVPFLLAEREARVAALRELIDRADLTAGEKYRRIMEAYLVEVDYGRTIEAYRGELRAGNEVRTVDFLRIGRVGLYYQTLDGAESGRWSASTKAFETLGGDARRPIQAGLRIARKQAPPELLPLPVQGPENAR